MRSYRNVALDLIECFEECNFNLIPRLQNCITGSLATYTTVFKVTIHPSGKYEVEVRHRPFVLDNVKNWQVFEDDKQVQKFLNLTWYFDGLINDEYNRLLGGSTLTQECLQSQTDSSKEMPRDDIIVPTEGVVGSDTENVVGE